MARLLRILKARGRICSINLIMFQLLMLRTQSLLLLPKIRQKLKILLKKYMLLRAPTFLVCWVLMI
ncbi:hypothetical protein HMPREF2710_06415 [Rothia sp. HMSC069D01]|nr:hypothetical protein HMPREF2710_06415 [Rothia sp. HMSC069D01]OFR62477.1 hypothetical protein HMPREF2879_08300 [Rothia sp. HMSC069C04]